MSRVFLKQFTAIVIATLMLPMHGAVHPVTPGMFEFYEANRTLRHGNLITEDFLLLTYSMILERSVAVWESEKAYPGLRSFIERLEQRAAEAAFSEPVKANRQFLAVLRNLLEKKPAVPRDHAVVEELDRIRKAEALAHSSVLAQNIDYTQFLPRGHYTKSPELSRYFQAVRYAGAALFYITESRATGIDAATADLLTEQAVLLSRWIKQDPQSWAWYTQFNKTRFWVFGPAEDLQAEDLIRSAPSRAGSDSITTLRRDLLAYARKRGWQPAILSAAVDVSRLEPGLTARDVLTGWRLLPGSFTPGSAAGQGLVYSSVGKYLGKGQPLSLTTINGTAVKGFPLANEIMAMLGSREAAKLLREADETNYQGYAAAVAAAQKQLAKPAGLAGEHLTLLRQRFALNDNHAAQALATARGFWTWCRHGSVLYAKQSYTGVGRGLQVEDARMTAWLDPAVELYAGLRRLAGEIAMKLGSEEMGLFAKVLDRCITIAKAERGGKSLSEDDIRFLNGLDLELRPLTGGPDHPIAVDVHTDVNSQQVLIQATAYPAVTSHNGAFGPRFVNMEFRRGMSDRLTDEAWLEILRKKENGSKEVTQ